jgi:lysozyme family protein
MHFDLAVNDVLAHEGGFIDHPNDKGGATAYGISLRFLRVLPDIAGDIDGDGHVDLNDVKGMTKSHAKAFYHEYFWRHYRLGEVRQPAVAVKALNLYVNMRGKTAALVLQRAVNDCRYGEQINEDGIAGSATLAALNSCKPEHLVPCIQWRQWQVYKAIVDNDSSQRTFIRGWKNRAFS